MVMTSCMKVSKWDIDWLIHAHAMGYINMQLVPKYVALMVRM